MNRFQKPARVRALATAIVATLGAGALIAVPAAAEPLDCPGSAGEAGNATELQDELQCAAASAADSYSITLKQGFEVPADFDGSYSGTANLVIDGKGHTVSGAGDEDREGPLFIFGDTGLDGESSGQIASFSVTIRNLGATGFSGAGVVISVTTGHFTLENVSFHHNTSNDGGATPGGAVMAAGLVTVEDSSFVNNEGAFGGAFASVPAFFEPGEDQVPSTLTIRNSQFQGNRSALVGGAIVALGSVDITDSSFVDNAAPVGGAIAILGADSASLNISGSVFTDNAAADLHNEGQSHPIGGAIVAGADTVITGSVFTDNTSGYEAGSIAVLDGFGVGQGDDAPSLAVTDSEITGSSAQESAGAISANGNLTITGTTVSDSASDGSVIVAYGNTMIDSSTFSNNHPKYGATLELSPHSGGRTSVTNSTFVGNGAGKVDGVGALIVSGEHPALLAHNTFSDNVGELADHMLVSGSGGDVEVYANVFTGESTVAACVIEGEVASLYNFDADGTCTDNWSGTDDFGRYQDAQLGVLANNGGATKTLLPGADSPLIDVIPLPAGSHVLVDQRGQVRPYGDGYDIGSVEVGAPVEDDEGDVPDDTDPVTPAGDVTFQVKTDAGVLYGTASPAIAVTDINWTASGDLTGAPADTALPYGAAGFTVEVPEPGASVTITLTAPAPFTSAYKVSGETWTAIPGATLSNNGRTVTYTLTDGGDLDEDGKTDGFIVDPVALAVQATFTG